MYKVDVNFCQLYFNVNGQKRYSAEFYFFSIFEVKDFQKTGSSLVKTALILAKKDDLRLAVQPSFFYYFCENLIDSLKEGSWEITYVYNSTEESSISKPLVFEGSHIEKFSKVADMLKEILTTIIQEQ